MVLVDSHRRLDSELASLRDRVLLLGSRTETALHRSMYALTVRDSFAAQEVLTADDEIDQLELDIDRHCIDILALHQPAACDLRFVVSVAKIAPILERIADHACNIARATIDLNTQPQLRTSTELSRMAEHASSMLRAALDAFIFGDPQTARLVIDRDDEIDAIYDRFFHDLLSMMVINSAITQGAPRLLFIAKHLERIGDYVTDICELTVYMTEAAFIKHSN